MEDNRHDNIITYDTPAYKPRKKKIGDRRDGPLLISFSKNILG